MKINIERKKERKKEKWIQSYKKNWRKSNIIFQKKKRIEIVMKEENMKEERKKERNSL